MRIAIDIREACKEKKTGKGQWTAGFVRELARRNLPVIAFTDRPIPSTLSLPTSLPKRIFPEKGIAWHWRVARHLRRGKEASLYVSPTSYIVPALLGKRFPMVPVVHDLIAFRGEPHDRKATLIERLTLGRAVRCAKRICTVSVTTKRDLLERYPSLDAEKIVPIFAGPQSENVTPNVSDGKTILCPATLSPRKNQERLIRAYASLPEALHKRYRLVLVGGRGWLDDEIVALATSTQGVEWRAYVPEDEYQRLLSACALLALPSLYEGFGLQFLDALQRGTPILTSDRGSIREVCGNAAHYVDPEHVPAIAEGLATLLKNPRLQADLRDRALDRFAQFSWRKTVDLFLQAIADL